MSVNNLGSDNLKQYEDRKKVVAAIYLNTMSNKVSNVDNRERQRRRQSDSGVIANQPGKNGSNSDQQESGAVGSSTGGGAINRSQLYGVEKSSAQNASAVQ